MSDFQRDFLKAKLAKLPVLPPDDDDEEEDEIAEESDTFDTLQTSMPPPSLGSPFKNARRDMTPLAWQDYFDEEERIQCNEATFQIYKAGKQECGPVFVMHHGAGYSALSFGLVAKELTAAGCNVVAFDARGHGKTVAENETDLSLEQLSQDLVAIIKALWDTLPELFLVGHSMGGAVVAQVGSLNILPIQGVAVLDVVEGSAMDALASMEHVLSIQPKEFKSVEQAIEWHIRTGTIHNRMSARLSVPPLLVQHGDIMKWRADLASTRPFWTGWFTGLSKKFLSVKAAKLLLLAGTDRLDKELTIAQMQGRYQLVVLPDVGHCLQEDAPEKTAETLIEFWKRNDRNIVIKRQVPGAMPSASPMGPATSHQLGNLQSKEDLLSSRR